MAVRIGKILYFLQALEHMTLSVSNQLLLIKLGIARALHERTLSIAHPT